MVRTKALPVILAAALLFSAASPLTGMHSLAAQKKNTAKTSVIETKKEKSRTVETPSGEILTEEELAEKGLSEEEIELLVEEISAPKAQDLVKSTFAILLDADTGEVLAGKNEDIPMFPASMTKVMTVLVACEHIRHLSDTFTITEDILKFCAAHDLTTVGYQAGEDVPVMDLLFGTILPSGADASLALGRYCAGSDAAFVDLMNEKAEELELSSTHFTNNMGIRDAAHFSTVHDTAKILMEAQKNLLARTVLSTTQYQTVATPLHPDGIAISNLFLRRIATLDTGGLVMSAKTGFINDAKFCAASFMIAKDGRHYVCVTGQAPTTMECIGDQAALYKSFTEFMARSDRRQELLQSMDSEASPAPEEDDGESLP